MNERANLVIHWNALEIEGHNAEDKQVAEEGKEEKEREGRGHRERGEV